jgi:hypothetical protein
MCDDAKIPDVLHVPLNKNASRQKPCEGGANVTHLNWIKGIAETGLTIVVTSEDQ